jgi:biotin carboxyl carrier protein
MKYITTINEREYTIEILDDFHVRIDDHEYNVDFVPVSGQSVFSILIDGASYEAYILLDENEWQVVLQGNLYPVKVEDEREKRLRATAGGNIILTGDTPIKAPMPGLVIGVNVQDGQTVSKGDTLMILESMKMQNELRAPRDGTVTRLRVQTGESVERNQILGYVG